MRRKREKPYANRDEYRSENASLDELLYQASIQFKEDKKNGDFSKSISKTIEAMDYAGKELELINESSSHYDLAYVLRRYAYIVMRKKRSKKRNKKVKELLDEALGIHKKQTTKTAINYVEEAMVLHQLRKVAYESKDGELLEDVANSLIDLISSKEYPKRDNDTFLADAYESLYHVAFAKGEFEKANKILSGKKYYGNTVLRHKSKVNLAKLTSKNTSFNKSAPSISYAFLQPHYQLTYEGPSQIDIGNVSIKSDLIFEHRENTWFIHACVFNTAYFKEEIKDHEQRAYLTNLARIKIGKNQKKAFIYNLSDMGALKAIGMLAYFHVKVEDIFWETYDLNKEKLKESFQNPGKKKQARQVLLKDLVFLFNMRCQKLLLNGFKGKRPLEYTLSQAKNLFPSRYKFYMLGANTEISHELRKNILEKEHLVLQDSMPGETRSYKMYFKLRDKDIIKEIEINKNNYSNLFKELEKARYNNSVYPVFHHRRICKATLRVVTSCGGEIPRINNDKKYMELKNILEDKVKDIKDNKKLPLDYKIFKKIEPPSIKISSDQFTRLFPKKEKLSDIDPRSQVSAAINFGIMRRKPSNGGEQLQKGTQEKHSF